MSTTEIKINWWVPILKGLVFFALGVFVINQPDESMKFFISTLGLVLILLGIGLVSFSYYTRNSLSNYTHYMIFGIVQILLGIYIYFNQESAGRIISVIIALIIGFSGVMNFLTSLSIRKYSVSFWKWVLVISLIEIILAILFLFEPEAMGLTIISFIGVGMIVFALLNILIGVNLKRSINLLKSENTDIE